MSPTIRPESPHDAAAIRAVHAAAFPSTTEAELVDALRRAGDLAISLVAQLDEAIVGHVALSPLTFRGDRCSGLGLAPMAVLPEFQHRAIGSQLVEAALAASVDAGYSFAVVLGEPAYYRRFGFRPASEWGLDSEYDAGDAFMARPITVANGPPTTVRPAMMPRNGRIRYARAFGQLG